MKHFLYPKSRIQLSRLGPKENIDKIERVQRRAARYVYNNYDYSSSVTTMLEGII
jgi:hypothetical protein